MEAVVCYGMSHSTPFCPNCFTCKCSLVWFEASAALSILNPHQNSSLCRGGPETLALWDRPLHMFQQFIDGVNAGLG